MKARATLRVSSIDLGLDVGFTLSPAVTQFHRDILARVCNSTSCYSVRHSQHTGPEISCPIDAASLGLSFETCHVSEGETTRHPRAGDLVMICAPPHHWGAFPASALVDIGIFYDEGGALRLPFGWVDGTVVGTCRPKQLSQLGRAGLTLRELKFATLCFGMGC